MKGTYDFTQSTLTLAIIQMNTGGTLTLGEMMLTAALFSNLGEM